MTDRAVAPQEADRVRAEIRKVIRHYKQHFAEVDRNERYKWEAIGWYKQHWNIDAPDFTAMLEIAFSKTENLLTSGMYYPYRMIVSYAQADPEEVRRIFKQLHNEALPLAQRYSAFRESCQRYIDKRKLNEPGREKALQHYQDLRAVTDYLAFEYPEKYYLFKSRMFTTFRDRVGFSEEKPKQRSIVWKVESYNRMCEIVLAEVKQDAALQALSQARLNEDCYQDDALHLLTMDIIYYGSAYMEDADFAPEQGSDPLLDIPPLQDEHHTDTQEGDAAMTDIRLNTILYGPPGTGKTYHTVTYAVAIIENRELASVAAEPYRDVLARYNAYKAQGRIEFTTFHQSFGYEEFIEGIRPIVSGEDENSEAGDIHYSVQAGIFKRFCERAERPAAAVTTDYGIGENPSIWKVSLDGTGDNPIRSECLKEGHVRIGWDEYGESITDATDFSKHGGRVVLNSFMNRMQIGDIVLSCYSASTIDAIGVVTGDCEWHDEYPRLKRLRKVDWIVKDIQENILHLNGGTSMTLSSVYRMGSISLTDVYQLIDKHRPAVELAQSRQKNYVFIIDEINRGNISKIFGELITLIEESKRIGQPEGLTVRLPYSQKPFGIPDNIFIIGTMNTADRSIAMIDTALRRRFQFREMLPDPHVLADVMVEDLSISEMLKRMNQRITVLYDREHTIGHAYFMSLHDHPTVETLAEIFRNSIIPLLQEYFYEDYEKIRLVLGDPLKSDPEEQFITAHPNDYSILFGNADIGLDESVTYEINEKALGNIDAYRSI